MFIDDISALIRNEEMIINALESTWLVVYCVQNSKPQPFWGAEKIPSEYKE